MTNVRCRGLAVAVAVTLAAASALPFTSALAQATWKLPSAYPADNSHSENLAAFASDLAQASGGPPVKLRVPAAGASRRNGTPRADAL